MDGFFQFFNVFRESCFFHNCVNQAPHIRDRLKRKREEKLINNKLKFVKLKY